ncbi:flagellar basal body P-ring formation protein FlgA [Massilia arenosa]|uniref:Flagella basal body P-ring formation protein FlgA n=1 Tax=Zemynaea arenosa TaxID=2561931 RepID=A0A4Y9SU01_9BURK|nr:flagellar basal body P-ring formation chaperone FlgA [Massilia arenosa]TFW29918.1 flagellar basal body P-ring formation protein FlgA [Massilia arenosa]
MKALFTALFAAAALPSLALAQAGAPRQDPAALKAVAEQYLKLQASALPGKVTVTMGALDPRLSLAACAAPEAFQQPGARSWGKVTVGVRCTAPSPWTVYLQAQVSVVTDYVASAVPLAQGQPVTAAQLVKMQGDLGALPQGVITDMAQAVGKSPTVSLPAGAPLRLDNLKSRPVVQQGQLVRVVSSGAGFAVSAEGRAIGSAAEGQVVQVRTPAGAVVSGIAQAGGAVLVAF